MKYLGRTITGDNICFINVNFTGSNKRVTSSNINLKMKRLDIMEDLEETISGITDELQLHVGNKTFFRVKDGIYGELIESTMHYYTF